MESPRSDASPPPPPPTEFWEVTEEAQEEQRARELLAHVLTAREVSAQTALELIAGYRIPEQGDAREEAARTVAEQYGIPYDHLSARERDRLLVLHHTRERARTATVDAELAEHIESILHTGLARIALTRLEDLRGQFADITDVETGRATLVSYLESIRALATRIPPEEPTNARFWEELLLQFQSVAVQTRTNTADASLRTTYEAVFNDHREFIEDDLIAREAHRRTAAQQSFDLEQLTAAIYGRTPDELEALKRENRARVVERIRELRDIRYLDFDILEELAATNNRGIVPRSFARLRSGEQPTITFGTRVSTRPEDVHTEVANLLTRTNKLIDVDAIHGISDARYAIAIAKLHNDLLDIHPFSDRNGSTALLFIELMMARRGHDPSPERPTNYYTRLRSALGSNPIAIGLVAYEHFKIAHIPGYYEGKTTKGKEKEYDHIVQQVRIFRREEKKRLRQWQAAKKPTGQ